MLPAAEQEKSIERAIWHRIAGGEAQTDEALLKKLIEDHHSWTGSLRAREILDNWATARDKFVKVFPNEYKRALGELHATQQADQTIAKAKGSDAKASKTVPAK